MPLYRCLYKGTLFYTTEHTCEFWNLYNTDSCILKEPAHLLPEYIESQGAHEVFSRPYKVRDGVKWSKRNEVTGKFLPSGRINTHCCELTSTTLGLENYRVETLDSALGKKTEEKNMEQKSSSHKIAAVNNIWLWFSFYLYPFHIVEVLLTYWICYWLL